MRQWSYVLQIHVHLRDGGNNVIAIENGDHIHAQESIHRIFEVVSAAGVRQVIARQQNLQKQTCTVTGICLVTNISIFC